MSRSPATLSLDLDNLWSYLKVHGDSGWQEFPSYLDVVVPRILELLDSCSLKITVFVVGQDAALARNRNALEAIAAAGHEIGNHSFHHEPWLHRYAPDAVATEIARAEDAIAAATGVRPAGFRGPGYSLSAEVLRTLCRRGYRYDASTFPTFLGPLARAYYFWSTRLQGSERAERSALFGTLADGLRPLRPYRWQLGTKDLLEIPVTTMPGLKLPFHVTYLHWLAGCSERLADAYLGTALRLCDLAAAPPSMLLHPLDFLGRDDLDTLRFFPAMGQPAARKLERVRRILQGFGARYAVQPLGAFATTLAARPLPLRPPRFGPTPPAEFDKLGEAERAR